MGELVDKDEIRVGTEEREEAISLLGDHLAAGRLTVDEYEQRVDDVVSARTRGEVRQLFQDLPAPLPAFLAPAAIPATEPTRTADTAPVVYSDKSRIAAGLLQIVLPIGAGRFYAGHTGVAVAQLVVTMITFGGGAIWSIIDGILLLCNGGEDGRGRPLRD